MSIWPPLRLARMRCEREAVGVVVPTSVLNRAHTGRRTAEAIHRTGWEPFAEVAVLEDGRVHAAGRVPTTALALETFARTLRPDDQVVLEATTNTHAVVRLLRPHLARVAVANPRRTRAMAATRRGGTGGRFRTSPRSTGSSSAAA